MKEGAEGGVQGGGKGTWTFALQQECGLGLSEVGVGWAPWHCIVVLGSDNAGGEDLAAMCGAVLTRHMWVSHGTCTLLPALDLLQPRVEFYATHQPSTFLSPARTWLPALWCLLMCTAACLDLCHTPVITCNADLV